MSKTNRVNMDNRLYRIIMDIWLEAESYTKSDIRRMLIEEGFLSPNMEEELIDDEKCPKCYNNLIHKKIGFEQLDVRGSLISVPEYRLECADECCDFVVE